MTSKIISIQSVLNLSIPINREITQKLINKVKRRQLKILALKKNQKIIWNEFKDNYQESSKGVIIGQYNRKYAY